MIKFKIGDRVAKATSEYYPDEYSDKEIVPLRYDPDNEMYVGEVVDISAKGKITVKWDGRYRDTEVLEAKDLITEEEGKTRWNQLESEFHAIEAQVAEKIKVVAQGIREANELAKKTGRPLADMGYDIIYHTLYDAMDEAGWRTSSFGC